MPSGSTRSREQWSDINRSEICDYQYDINPAEIDNSLDRSALEDVLLACANACNLPNQDILREAAAKP